MTFRFPSRLTLIAAVAPLTLGLAACKKDEPSDAGPPASATALAPVAAPAGKSWTDVIAATPDGGVLMGNPNAPIKVVEYGSLTCPHCAKFAQDGFQKLSETYVNSGRVSLEFRSFAIHPQDVPLTVLAQCAGTETFFPLVEQIYGNFDAMLTRMQAPGSEAGVKQAMTLPENQRFPAYADAMGMTEFFAARGISVDQGHACLADTAKINAVANRTEAYGKAGIDSTPTLFINGAKVNGNTWAEIEPALQRAGAR
jgi:hypothetical protein